MSIMEKQSYSRLSGGLIMSNDRRIDEALQCGKLSQVQWLGLTEIAASMEHLKGSMRTHCFRVACALATIPMDFL